MTLWLGVGLGDCESLGDRVPEVETLRVAVLQRVRTSLKVGDSGNWVTVGLGEGEAVIVLWDALPLAEEDVQGLGEGVLLGLLDGLRVWEAQRVWDADVV